MTENLDDLSEQGKHLYRNGVNQVLAGFQLIEEMLKTYIEMHLDMVRVLLDGRLHFDFRREDYQDAALGRLTQVFSKLCSNTALVVDLRAVAKRRDYIAHRALLKLYDESAPPAEYLLLIDEMAEDMKRNGKLMASIVDEMNKLHK